MSPILIVILCVAGLALMLVLLRAVVAGVSKAGAAAIAAAYREDQIVLSDALANCFGKQSLGAMQLRGNGGLVLTQDQLHFIPLAGAPSVQVSLKDLTDVELVGSFLGKAVGRKLLKVSWGGETADAAAFVVKEPERWRAEIERLRARPGE